MKFPTDKDLQAALQSFSPTPPEYIDEDDATLGPWTVSPVAVFTSFGRRTMCHLDGASTWGRSSKTLEKKGRSPHHFWSEPWDGTALHIRHLYERARDQAAEFVSDPGLSIAGTVIPPGEQGYTAILLERTWMVEGYHEDAFSVAVVPAIIQRIDERDELDLNVGYRKWLAALDEAMRIACCQALAK